MNNIIKGTAALALAVGLGLGTALGTAGNASATETGYLDNLTRGKIQINNSAVALKAGYLICTDLRNGYTVTQEASVVKKIWPSLTNYQAGWVVGSAIKELC